MRNLSELQQSDEMVEPGRKSSNRQGALNAVTEISEFLWNGRSNASLLQRASLVIFALIFMTWAVYVFSQIPKYDSMVHRLVGFFTGLVWAFIALRLLRNTFLRSPILIKKMSTESAHNR